MATSNLLKYIPAFNECVNLEHFIRKAELVYKFLVNDEEQKQFLTIVCSKLPGLQLDALKLEQQTSWSDLKRALRIKAFIKESETLHLAKNLRKARDDILNSEYNVKTGRRIICPKCCMSGHTGNNCSHNKCTFPCKVEQTILHYKFWCIYCKHFGHPISDCENRKCNNLQQYINEDAPQYAQKLQLLKTHVHHPVKSVTNSFNNIQTLKVTSKIIKLPIMFIGGQYYIPFPYNRSKSSFSKFQIDTGAEISLFRYSALRPHGRYTKSNRLIFTGIQGEPRYSPGHVIGKIKIANMKVSQCFHLVDDNVQFIGEGLLGIDFLRKYEAEISYKTLQLFLTIPQKANLPELNMRENVLTGFSVFDDLALRIDYIPKKEPSTDLPTLISCLRNGCK